MNREELQYLKYIDFKNKLEKLNIQLKNKKVVLYGAGILLETAIEKYDFTKLNIIAISDKKFEREPVESFAGVKTINSEKISELNPDVILLSVKNYKNLYIPFISKYQNIEIIPLFVDNYHSSYDRMNINHNVFVECNGLHGKKKKNYPKIIVDFIKLKNKLNYKLGNIDIPQIEFNLTTVCTLKCKHCSNFIPYLKPKEHSKIKLDDFKTQLSNLTNAVRKVKNLILLGGEPLTIPNLYEYVEIAAKNKKIERLWIVTNGTLLINDKLKKTLSKYRNKITVWVSNYSKNEELKDKLKHTELLKQIKALKLDYDYVKDLSWGYTSPYKTEKVRENSELYFECCGNHCVSVFEGKLYVCPRAGIFDKKGIYIPQENEVIDLNTETNVKVLKKKLKDFYSRNTFTACNYCTVLEDRMLETIMPAIQLH